MPLFTILIVKRYAFSSKVKGFCYLLLFCKKYALSILFILAYNISSLAKKPHITFFT
jgi:hypothetical protein